MLGIAASAEPAFSHSAGTVVAVALWPVDCRLIRVQSKL